MARLSQYPKDTTPNKQDSFLTLDSSTGNTTRIDMVDIASVVADQNLLETSDSALFQYITPNGLDYTAAQSGVLVVNPVGVNATRLFSGLTQIILAKSGVNGKNISTYINDLLDYQIKISQLGDLNVFGIFQVTAVTDYSDQYIKLSLTYKDRGSGNLTYGTKYYVSHHQTSFDQDFSDDSVTEFGDVYNAGSGFIITPNERARVDEVTSKIFYSDVVDNVTSNVADRPLSAAQGLILKQYIDNINTLLTSDEVSLNELQEIVDFIELNRTTLETLTIASVAGLQTALNSKVDKITGKQLSENDFTNALISKLNAIEAEAEVNVQANYTMNDSTDDSYIQNKPTDISDLTIHSAAELNDIFSVGSSSIITDDERRKIDGLSGTFTNNVETISDLNVAETLSFLNSQDTEPAYSNAIYYNQEDAVDVLQFKSNNHRVSMDNIVNNMSTGILDGGVLGISGTNSFTITAGDGVVLDFNKESAAAKPHPELKHISWAAQTIVVSDLDGVNATDKQTWIYVDELGVVNQQSVPFTNTQYNFALPIGAVIHNLGVVTFAKSFPRTAYGQQNQFGEFARLFGPMKKNGLEVLPIAGTVQLQRSAGTAYAPGRNYDTDPNNPSFVTDSAQNPCAIHRYYQDSAGDFIRDTNGGAGYTTIDNTLYDDGTGTLATIGNNKFTIQRVYYFPNNPTTLIVYYGRTIYDTLDAANTNLSSEPFTESKNTANQAVFLGYLLMEKGATDLSSTTNVRIIQAGIFRSVAFSSTGAAASAASISDLSDTTITAPSQGQLLEYDATTQTFKNFTPLFDQTALAYAIALGG